MYLRAHGVTTWRPRRGSRGRRRRHRRPPRRSTRSRSVLRSAGHGAAHRMEKTHVAWGDGHTLHAIGAVDEAAGLVATKTWAHTGGGATPLVIVWDAEAGELLADHRSIRARPAPHRRDDRSRDPLARTDRCHDRRAHRHGQAGRGPARGSGCGTLARRGRGLQPERGTSPGVRRTGPDRPVAVRGARGRIGARTPLRERTSSPRRHARPSRSSTPVGCRPARSSTRSGRSRPSAPSSQLTSLPGATWSSPTARRPPARSPPSCAAGTMSSGSTRSSPANNRGRPRS